MSDSSDPLALEAALRPLGITLPPDQLGLLVQYCQLLWRWNEQLNLTRHTTLEQFATRDVLDTVRLAAHLEPGEEVLDLGSGGGVPGVVLAIVRPDLSVCLAESVGKKARVLDDIVQALGLPVPVQHQRAEQVLGDFRFDSIVARAVGPLWKILTWLEPHWPSIGRLLLIKGPRWVDERGEARHRGLLSHLELRCLESYPMPGTESHSVILKIWPKR